MAIRVAAFLAFFISTVCIAVSPVSGESADQALVSSTDDYVLLPTGNTRLPVLGGVSDVQDQADRPGQESEGVDNDLCKQDVDNFIQDNRELVRSKGESQISPNNMVFFLHIPRTAGRALFHCFLSPATPPSKRCMWSYDALRLNVSLADCGLLSSHDNYSVAGLLPDTTSIITQVRDPVDRILSAYEFLVEIAASELQRSGGSIPARKAAVATANVWPWSILLPVVEADLRARVKRVQSTVINDPAKQWVEHRVTATGRVYYHNYYTKRSVWSVTPADGMVVPALDPYDNPLAMPLREFIEHPLVRDTLHNGQSLQLLGLTEHSYLNTSSHLRSCIAGLPDVRKAMTGAALERLGTLLHVGVTDRLEESVASAATTLGKDLGGPSWNEKGDTFFSDENEEGASDGASQEDSDREQRKLELEAKIAEIIEGIGAKGIELRRTRSAINRAAQEKAAGGSESASEGEELSELIAHTDSVTAEIADMRREIADLEVQIVKLKTPPPRMLSTVAQVKGDDDDFLHEWNVTGMFNRCISGSRAKNRQRWRSFRVLTTMDGRTMSFSSETRKRISPQIVRRIRDVNPMDAQLYEEANKLLTASLERQVAAGTGQRLDRPLPFPGMLDQPQPPLPSEGVEAAATNVGQSTSDAGAVVEGAQQEAAGAAQTVISHESGVVNASDYVVLATGNTQLPVLGGGGKVEVEEERGGLHESVELKNTCEADVDEFIRDNRELVWSKGAGNVSEANPKDMLFFLHVPRTAGRDFLNCFLTPATPPSKRCASSYDVLRLNVSADDCGLLSSHDDYSVTKLLPQTSAVITQLRDPVQRVLSAYEFLVEIASAELRRPIDTPKDADLVLTSNVWPWSLLLPWIEADMRARVKTVKSTAVHGVDKHWVEQRDVRSGRVYYHNYYTKQSVWSVTPEDGYIVPALDPYDNPLAMPLRDFIEHPLVRDTLHNGESLQLLGLTEYSHLNKSNKLRSCISGLPDVREAMTEAALNRLSTLYHVGVTDRLEESVASAATTLGLGLGGPSWKAIAGPPKVDNETVATDEKAKEEQSLEATRLELEARIAEITELIALKGRESRLARNGILRTEEKIRTGSVDEGEVDAEEELSRFVAQRDQAETDIADLRRQIVDLQVEVVKLRTPLPRTHSKAARISKDDSELVQDFDVTKSFHRCVTGSRAKNTLRWQSYLGLTVADGRGIYHSSETRNHISPDIIDRIRQLNSMDFQLYQAASKRLIDSIDRQVAAGTKQELSPAKPFPGIRGLPRPPMPPKDLSLSGSTETEQADTKSVVLPMSNQDVAAQSSSGVDAAADGVEQEAGGDAPTATSREKALVSSSGFVVLATGNTQTLVLGGVSTVDVEDDQHASDEETAELESSCEADVEHFIQGNRELVRSKEAGNATQANPKDMLFFLHVPRTAGRTFQACFLKPATPPSKRCAKSYDALRLNVSVADCGLLSSHDDYSVTEFLPDTAAVITQIRDPLERVVSAYEFAVVNAFNGLKSPSNGSKPKAAKLVTTNVWPWSILLPWMEADMQARVKRVQSTGVYPPGKQWVEQLDPATGRVYYHNFYTKRSVWSVSPEDGIVVPALDPYDNPLAMPLRDFIEHPLVRDTLHNGQSLQLLGLTSYSHMKKASKLRSCISGLPDVQEVMTEAAVARLGTLYHVGVSERLDESVASAAVALGLDLGGPTWRSDADAAVSYDEDVEVEGGAEDVSTVGQARAELEARIADLDEEISFKGIELRRTRVNITIADERAKSSLPGGHDSEEGNVADELSQLVAYQQQVTQDIDSFRQQIADLRVEIVKLKSPERKMHSVAARIVKDDEEFRNARNLTMEYMTCSGQTRVAKSQMWKSHSGLMTADGRSFYFTSETRKLISPDIVARIRHLNNMDVQLYAAANNLLGATLEQQAAAGTLQVLSGRKSAPVLSIHPRPPLPSSEGLAVPGAPKTAQISDSSRITQEPQRNTRTATPHETALVSSNGGVVLPTGNTQLNVFGGVSDIEVENVKHTTDNKQAAELQNFCDADVARFVGDNRELVRSRGAGNATQSSPRDMLFFLHAPRTAGSTFLTCFLQPATPPSKRCDLSCDVLRLNVSASGCGLLSSHDDYSVTKYLPDASAVATQVRDPVARLLSAYEFVVGIAAAQVNKQSKVPMTKPGTIVTGNVWPWSEIIPWVEGDMLARVEKVMSTAVYTPTKQWVEHRDARTGRVYYHNYYTRRSVWSLSPEDGIVVPALDPYDNPLAMPLREFIEHPLVRDNLHNGQSLQLLGLTTYSHLNESSKLRSCISGLPDVREAMTEAALARLETLLHVGVSDRLEDSIASAATSLGIKLDGPSWKTPPSDSDDTNAPDVEELNERMNQTRVQLEAKIEGITEDIAAKGRDLRRARFAIKRVQEEAQSAGVDHLDGAAEEEVSQLVALTERLNEEIGELREQISELKVKIVRLKIPQPEVRSAARQITKDDDELLNPANVAQNHEICAIQGIFQNKQKWRSYAGLMTVDGRSFFHSSETRKHISPEIIDRIRHLNSMDANLYKAAQRILTESLDRQAVEGTRQVMSPPKPLLQYFGASQPPLPTEEIVRSEIAETAEVHKSTEAVPESPQADELTVDDGQESQAYLTSGVNAAAEELHSNNEHQQHDSFEAECPLEHTTSHDEL